MFSSVTRLGLIACQYLAKFYPQGRYVAAPEIAEKHQMNVRALMPALRQLTKSGILRSRVGGSEPGFIFTRNPEELSILDILMVLEGDYRFLCCKESNSNIKCNCLSKDECNLYHIFNSMIGQAKSRLSEMSIIDHRKKRC